MAGPGLVLPAPVWGQGSAEAPLVDEISVEVVDVDVVVADSRGRPVTGLTADDFVLYGDGVTLTLVDDVTDRCGTGLQAVQLSG